MASPPREDMDLKMRHRLAQRGAALPDGSFPIPDCDALDDAIHAYGRAPESHRAALRRLIRRRNSQLRCGKNMDKFKVGGEKEPHRASDGTEDEET